MEENESSINRCLPALDASDRQEPTFSEPKTVRLKEKIAISGDEVHVGTITYGKEWGRESELAYVIQSGPLKRTENQAK